MANEIATQQTFQERISERIRQDIGQLMTDDELKAIIERCVEETFFAETEVRDGYHTRKEPPWVYSIIKELLTESVEKEVKAYFSENKDQILAMIHEIVQEGLGQAVIGSITSKFQSDMLALESNITHRIQQY